MTYSMYNVMKSEACAILQLVNCPYGLAMSQPYRKYHAAGAGYLGSLWSGPTWP